MIRNYLKIAFRNLFKYKLFSFINIFGLALSMSICMLVLLRIKDQVGYDQFHPHKNHIYRLITELDNRQGDQFRFASTPLLLADVLSKDYSVLESWVRLCPAGAEKGTSVQKTLAINSVFADSPF